MMGQMKPWRIALWGAPILILLAPLIAMQFTAEVNWTGFDFLVAGVLLFGTAAAYEVAMRISASQAYRAGAALALLTGLVLVWVNLAVGIIGNENNPANLMYAGVLGVGLVGTLVARLQPKRMMWVLLATALAQALVAGIALFAGLGAEGPLSIIFAAPWLLSAWLFRKAAAEKRFTRATA
jgi:hypothetical protein